MNDTEYINFYKNSYEKLKKAKNLIENIEMSNPRIIAKINEFIYEIEKVLFILQVHE